MRVFCLYVSTYCHLKWYELRRSYPTSVMLSRHPEQTSQRLWSAPQFVDFSVELSFWMIESDDKNNIYWISVQIQTHARTSNELSK